MEENISEDMSPKDFLRLINWMKDRGWRYIRFLGGEPTFHPQFVEMLDICYRNKIYFSISTNNIFSSLVSSKLSKPWLVYLSINYVFGTLDNERKTIFKDNLGQLSEKRIPFEFSYIIGHQNDDWQEIFEIAKFYKPVSIRVSIEVPGLAKQMSVSGLVDNFSPISKKIFAFQENCLKQRIPFYIFRPLMPCLFSQQEWKRLKGSFPFVCFTRCPIGCGGDYSATVVVNPDLSIFPCIAVFLKGPSIFTFKGREEISEFYKEKVQQMLSEPLTELCKTCEKHSKFIDNLKKGKNSDLKLSFDEGVCQAGCLSFKKSSQTLCCLE